ncbi:MAG TPA: acyltransferase domain-containing protein, partial [Longimicrobium sp.]|nr:acyltransferase domain-containing protein [Longimicrobium sp.]
ISVANYNAPSQTVLSGEHDGLAEAARKVAELGGQAVPLRVSGAWHSPLMEEARARFGEALRRVEFRPPHRRLWLDITGEPEADPQRIAEAMHAQLSAPVRWTAVLEGVRVGGAGMFVEVGPGKVLRGLLRRTWRAADFRTVGVDGPAALPFLSRQVGAEAAS